MVYLDITADFVASDRNLWTRHVGFTFWRKDILGFQASKKYCSVLALHSQDFVSSSSDELPKFYVAFATLII
jgi:hypothetical protein